MERFATLCGRCRDILSQKYMVKATEEVIEKKTGVCDMCYDLRKVRKYLVTDLKERTDPK